TENNRGEILAALYTIMLGNPMFNASRDAAGGTRFKVWYRLVGSAVEHAASRVGEHGNFQKLFLQQEAESDEDITTLLEGLRVLDRRWPVDEFVSSDVVPVLNREGTTSDQDETTLFEMKHDSAVLREWLYPDEPNVVATAQSLGMRLKNHVDAPVQHGEETLVLRSRLSGGERHFFVAGS